MNIKQLHEILHNISPWKKRVAGQPQKFPAYFYEQRGEILKLGYITREEACEALYRLINSGVLDEGLEDALEEIAQCISCEETHKVFLWGADDDANDLFVSVMDPYRSSEEYRTPKNIEAYEEWRQHRKELYDKYKF